MTTRRVAREMRSRRRLAGRRWRKLLLFNGVVLVTVLGGGAFAAAHEDETTEARQLVRQAIALIVNTPGDMDGIDDKIDDALSAEDHEGVDLDLVRQAREALDREDMHGARSMLEQAIGARPHLGATDVAPIGEVLPAVGAEPGEAPILDPLDTGGVDGGDAAVIVGGVLLAVVGVFLSWRWRPVPTKGTR